MKYFYFLLLLFLAVSIDAQIQNYSLGDVVDDFTVTDIEGNEHNLYEYTAAGKYVYLDFFFTTCGPCQTTAPKFNEFFDKYGCGAGDVMCMSINRGESGDSAVADYDETYGGSFNHAPIISGDGGSEAVRTNFGVAAYPTLCLINPDNEIINLDIWPVSGVETFEATFPDGFNPEPMSCTVGVTDITEQVSFSIYPNPTNGNIFTINLIDEATAAVSIIDLLGKEIYFTTISTNKNIISADLSQGTYFVQVATDNAVSVRKLLVE